jgi:hypothetical protein
MKVHFTAILAVLLFQSVFAGHVKKENAQEKWILQRYQQLSKATPESIPKIELKEYESKDGTFQYFPAEMGGIIFLREKEWIMITQSSGHYEKSGDVTMIRTSENEFYLNFGHCCKTMIIDSDKKIETIEDFLAAKGKGHRSEPTPWKKYRGEPDGEKL